MHINEIAARADCPYDSAKLASCLRILAQHYIFKEVKENYFAHTRFSMTLRDENRVDFIRTSTQLAKIGPYFYEAMKRYPGSSNPRQSTFAVGTGIDGRESAFEWMLRNPEYHRRFSNGMEGTSRLAMANLQTVYPWRDLGPSVLVDIGGGKGHISMEIAKIAPQLRFIVQDTPAIVASATGIQLPEDLRGRIQFQIHDFWTVQPRRADVYLFRLIFHSWADEKVVRLIRNVLPHLRTGENGMGGRILVAESIIEAEKARPPSLMEQATINMMMMTIHNSSERTFGQYKALFERADSRFRVRQYGSGGPLASEILEAWLEE
ncbi:S-adenosyl-L-methionine-dependent methyltransferase [Ascobolus immersus RN42]|uniref:S-adenosyl-L-methionine-dependent methyltransferase n=1 Tax=Ascobolus immersus RN42 TaxID=1160509 RepID=A0A3N4IRS6_ASCIM|nr:S-adenosyl-L-methionine-dependent methyltransferase [Ascobolus immersus RN42]